MHKSIACAVLLCLATPIGARAAEPSDSWFFRSEGAVLDAAKAVGTTVGSVWYGVTSIFSASAPYDYLPGQISDDDRRFFANLEAVGLQLAEIRVGTGTFSHSSYRFVAARDPSDVDIQRAEHMLADYRASAGGLRAGAKQRIVQAVLDVAGDRSFILTAAEVELWPWPSVSYEITARNRPPEVSERRIIGALQTQ
jgi:hypothetical protein